MPAFHQGDKESIMNLDQDTRAQELVTRPVVYVHPNDTLRRLAETLVEESIGAALVRGPHGAIGLVSERDVVAAIADGVDPTRTRVDEIMNEDVIMITPNHDLLDAAHAMLDAEVRHLPIVEDGVVGGMISARDALRALVELREETAVG
jgi:CBS domain-containing protein